VRSKPVSGAQEAKIAAAATLSITFFIAIV